MTRRRKIASICLFGFAAVSALMALGVIAYWPVGWLASMVLGVGFVVLSGVFGRREPVDLAALAQSLELTDDAKRKSGLAHSGEGNLDITLVDPGPRRIKTIKHFRQLYDIELVTAAAVVDAAPVVIRAGASKAEADHVADYLAQSGAKVDVTEAER